MRDDFAVFIITHGRPDKQLTYNVLKKCGYTGKIYLVIDNTDTTIQQYINLYGVDNIIVFDKNHYINDDKYDNGTNEGVYACAVYARRATEEIAKSLCLTYFCMMDDDITSLTIRYTIDNKLRGIQIKSLDDVFDAYINVLSCNNVSCVGFSDTTFYYNVSKYFNEDKRPLAFVAFMRKTEIPNDWKCWYGEDELSGYYNNVQGKLWVAIPWVMFTVTGTTAGAMANTYATSTSFTRCFAEFRYRPTDFCIAECKRGTYKGQFRLYKKNRNWFPKIISSTYKKEK